MQNLALEEGEIVNLKSASLPKGTYVKLQPHTTDFIDISNPKAVLETTLRNFSCLTVGDQITINYNNRQYFIDIVEAKPQAAISVIETDCEVDFAPPLDYVEPTQQQPAPAPVEESGPGAVKPSSSTVCGLTVRQVFVCVALIAKVAPFSNNLYSRSGLAHSTWFAWGASGMSCKSDTCFPLSLNINAQWHTPN